MEAAFFKFKQSFTTALMLKHPDPDIHFIVEVDASKTAEANYDIGNQELLSIKEAIWDWLMTLAQGS